MYEEAFSNYQKAKAVFSSSKSIA